jgi:hypothetical protein
LSNDPDRDRVNNRSVAIVRRHCGIRSEWQLMAPLDYNLLYRWFVGLSRSTAAPRRTNGRLPRGYASGVQHP